MKPSLGRIRLGVVVGVVTATVGCSKPEPVRVTPRSVAVSAVSPQGLNLAVELDVQNPNAFPIRTQQVTGTVFVNGAEVARGSTVSSASVPAKGSAVVPATLSAPFTQLGALAPLALSGKPVPFEVRGVARVGGESLNMDVPFTLPGQLSASQLLQAASAR